MKSGGIQKLLVGKLDKYLNHHRLSTSGKKDLKMSRIFAHILKQDMAENDRGSVSEMSEGQSSEEDSDLEADESSDVVVLASVIDYEEDSSE